MDVVVAGEALIDLAPDDGRLVPLPGGSPFNVAVGLGRLGVRAGYVGALSRDGFGDLLATRLTAAGVDVSLAPRVDAPTTLAVVHLDAEARASYGFYLDGTAAAQVPPGGFPDPPPGTALHVSFGAVGVTHEVGDALLDLLRRGAGTRLTSLDPNVRPSAIDDLDRWRARLAEVVAVTDIVKVSDDDLALLYPDDDPVTVAEQWAGGGPVLVVLTRGPDGAMAFGGTGRVAVDGSDVAVADTVGAGDAFTSALLAHLVTTGQASRTAIARLDRVALTTAVAYAVQVAAYTCTRPGADPPTAAEMAAAAGG